MLCVCSALFFYPSVFAGAFLSFALPLFFIRKKAGLFTGLMVCGLYFFASHCLLVTDIKSYDNEKYNYATTGGTLISSQKLSVGTAVFGGFYKRAYAGEKEGRFARGYNVAERDGFSVSVPFMAGLLSFRKELSDNMFDSSGGGLRLTQAVMLGDRKYLERETTDVFIQTGLGHMLAISGLHVGLYGMVCFFLFGFLPAKLRLIPTGLMLLILIPFTGFKVPVLRAGLIGFCVVAAKFFDYETDFRKILLFFAGVFILIAPSMVTDPSFLLSFSAVYGLLHIPQVSSRKLIMPFLVGVVASVFITPAAAYMFGTFNISSIVTTPVLVPVLSAQVVVFFLYMFAPSVSLAPLVLLERVHLRLMDFFAESFSFMFTLYKTDAFWALLMVLFLFLCVRFRVLWFSFALLVLPYLPVSAENGGYFPNMGRSKGFVVQDDLTYIYYRGAHSDFLYGFLPYLASIGVEKADRGTIDIYGSENIFIPVAEKSDIYGWVCVNEDRPECGAVYHTRSDTYKCDDTKMHILYKNGCETENTYLLSKEGDLKIDYKSK